MESSDPFIGISCSEAASSAFEPEHAADRLGFFLRHRGLAVQGRSEPNLVPADFAGDRFERETGLLLGGKNFRRSIGAIHIGPPSEKRWKKFALTANPPDARPLFCQISSKNPSGLWREDCRLSDRLRCVRQRRVDVYLRSGHAREGPTV